MRLWNRLRYLVRRRQLERELEEEVHIHRGMAEDSLRRAGTSPREARHAASRALGNVTLALEDSRAQWNFIWLESLRQDLRYALRGLERDRMLTAAATVALALGIGTNTTIFSLVNTILLRPLPYPNSERLYWVSERMGRNQIEVALGSDYYSLREENRVFEGIGAYLPSTVNWTGDETPAQLAAALVTTSFFDVLGTQPMMGRYLAAGEEGAKAPPVAVLSYPFWRSRMGGNRQVIGQTITLDRMPHTIVGVMPQGFDYPRGTQLWKPLEMDEATQRPRLLTTPMRLVFLVARLKPQIGETQLAAEMNRLTQAIRAEYPKEFENSGYIDPMTIHAAPLQRLLTGDIRQALMVLTGAVGLVLLVACANIANLLLSRATTRQRELAVRMALGSSRARIVRQVLTEGLALALPGGLAGVTLSYLALGILNTWKPFALERYPEISMDFSTLAFTSGLTLVTALVFAMAPAFAAAHISVQDALKSSSHTQSGGRKTTRVRQLLVVAELGVSLVLLIGAGLLARSFLNLARTELGFPPGNLLTLRVNLAGSRYATAEAQMEFYENVMNRIAQLPMVRDVAVSTDIPLSGGQPYQASQIQIHGRAPLPMVQRPQANATVVSRSFFQTLRIPLRRGRTFGLEDAIPAADGIVINEAFARKIFPGEDPIGRRVSTQSNAPDWTIVGVVGDIRANQLGADPAPLMYHCECYQRNPYLSRMALIVRTAGDPAAARRMVEGQVYAVDRNQPLFDIRTMEERLEESLAPRRFQLLLIGTFAAIAAVLAALGVYGVVSFLVARRTHEIGIRIAMGARPAHLLAMVIGETSALVIAAMLAGLAGASLLTRYLKSLLYGVTNLDATTFAIMPFLLAALALAASFVPARRASRIDPMVALRDE